MAVDTDTRDNLNQLRERFNQALKPEDIFGSDADEAERSYRRLALATHPDRHDNDPLATQVFIELGKWWARAVQRIAAGVYGLTRCNTPDLTSSPGLACDPVTIAGSRGTYTIDSRATWVGDIADVFAANPNVIKIARQARDNDLLRNEASVLRNLRTEASLADHFPFVPDLIDSLQVKTASGTRLANVLGMNGLNPGRLHSLAEVHHIYPRLSEQHMAWIWRRLLRVLGFAHRRGYVHGAVVPEHVLIDQQHALMLIDWSYATPIDDHLTAIPSTYRHLYPQSALDKQPVTSALDITMSVKLMVSLMGGNPVNGTLLANVNPKLRAFFSAWWRTNPETITDAWQTNIEFTELIDSLWPRRFQPINLSGVR